jgi:hypothetical protein
MDVPVPPPALLAELQPAAKTIKVKIKMRFIFSPFYVRARNPWDWSSFSPEN